MGADRTLHYNLDGDPTGAAPGTDAVGMSLHGVSGGIRMKPMTMARRPMCR